MPEADYETQRIDSFESTPIGWKSMDGNARALYTATIVPSVFYDGTDTKSAVDAVVIGSSQACSEVLVQADPTNLIDVLVGASGSQSIRLTPGSSVRIPIDNVNKIYWHPATAVSSKINWWAI